MKATAGPTRGSVLAQRFAALTRLRWVSIELVPLLSDTLG